MIFYFIWESVTVIEIYLFHEHSSSTMFKTCLRRMETKIVLKNKSYSRGNQTDTCRLAFRSHILFHFYFSSEIVVQSLSNREYYVQVTVLLCSKGCLHCFKSVFLFYTFYRFSQCTIHESTNSSHAVHRDYVMFF